MKRIFFQIFLYTLFINSLVFSQTIIAPDELEAEPEDSSYIKVKWDDNSNNEEGFFVERASGRNDSAYWEVIDVVPASEEIYFDYWITRGIVYYYRVFAYSGNVRSDYSNIDSAVLQGDTNFIPQTPTNLTVLSTTPKSITIGWQDNSYTESGFIIARKKEDQLFYEYIDTVSMDILTYQEVGLTPDALYFYKVCAYNNSGISDYSNVVSAVTPKNTLIINTTPEIPVEYYLGDNFPNPFNPKTNIKFGIKSGSFVSLIIYNSAGIETENLLSRNLQSGTYQIQWNAEKYTSGIYFYRLETKEFSQAKKMILLK